MGRHSGQEGPQDLRGGHEGEEQEEGVLHAGVVRQFRHRHPALGGGGGTAERRGRSAGGGKCEPPTRSGEPPQNQYNTRI